MSKFNHTFKLNRQTENSLTYICDDITARIDFISSSAIRVALFKDTDEMLPTFNVNPQNELSANGRNRLDTSGFELCTPKVTNENGTKRFYLPCGVSLEVQTQNFILKYYQGEAVLF
ncbi:MAG: hypothetical protein NC110_08730, partial [Ruminococcus sp.]|nr:hypothetical protein [Ruminococcus sp.]